MSTLKRMLQHRSRSIEVREVSANTMIVHSLKKDGSPHSVGGPNERNQVQEVERSSSELYLSVVKYFNLLPILQNHPKKSLVPYACRQLHHLKDLKGVSSLYVVESLGRWRSISKSR